MGEIYSELEQQKNVRQNLSLLRKQLKEGLTAESLREWVTGHEELCWGFLASGDAKTRKNAALLFGDLRYLPAVSHLWQAYEREQTLFVRSAYLEALGQYSVEQIQALPAYSRMKEQAGMLEGALLRGIMFHPGEDGTMCEEPIGENRKHIGEELRALRQILIRCEGITRHAFDLTQKDNTVLLVTNRMHREVVRQLVDSEHARIHPLGVLVRTDDLSALLRIRAYRELLFLPPQEAARMVPNDPDEAAKSIAPWLAGLCVKYHGESECFYFRVECKSTMTMEQRAHFTRRLGAALEIQSEGRFINSPGDYEVELRLVMNREGCFFACVKFLTLPDTRFSYRKNAISASIHPSAAALIMEMARPWLKENAQILDPFCGVGTMLIERNIAMPARDKYGTDIFGDAIEFGRENALLAGADIHFIHRDFFDFRHDYRFDEIITNMPLRGKKTKEEADRLYERFFSRAAELLKPGAVIVMYTNERGFVKKQLRLHREYTLLQESAMQTKTEFYLMIIGIKG